MPILIYCPQCAAKIRAPEQAIGRQIRCPKCEAEFTATSDETVPPPVPPEPAPSPPPPAPEPAPPSPPEPRVEAPRPELPPEDDREEEDREDEPKPTPAPGTAAPTNSLVEFLLFRTMISPIIIQVIFWIGVIASIGAGGFFLIAAIGLMAGGKDAVFAFLQALMGLGLLVLGPLAVRVCCELTILFFRIYDSLRELHALMEKPRRPE
jgi:hypothetical protein